MIVPILYTQSAILTEVNDSLRNTASRWSDAEVYASINRALVDWSTRVKVPFVYTLSDGFDATTLEYDLPDYIDGQITPQALRYQEYPYLTVPELIPDWYDLMSYSVQPTETGGQKLRLNNFMYSQSGRIVWWAVNGSVPVTLPVLSAGIDSDDTSLVLTTRPMVGRNGFVCVDTEWMQYSGVTVGSTTLTLNNLVRGIYDTTAASHLSAASVTWGIAMDTPRLYNQLLDSARGYLMEYFLFDGATMANEQYQSNWTVFRSQADKFWRTYTPSRVPRMMVGGRMF